MVSLDAFQKAFCATAPARWSGSAGIRRTSMTQPGVYFTLDTPVLSIIGLYSNCGESFGWLDEQQLLFLYQELTRLKAARRIGLPPVILAIHHFPRWFPTQKPKDPNSTAIAPTRGNPTLRFEYHSVKQTSNEPDDVCTIDLQQGKLV